MRLFGDPASGATEVRPDARQVSEFFTPSDTLIPSRSIKSNGYVSGAKLAYRFLLHALANGAAVARGAPKH
jgi:hypothetical protein